MRVLAVAGDAGGARALLPVIEALRARGIEVTCAAYKAATSIWREAALEVSDAAAADPGQADRVLLGTSAGDPQLELDVIARAAERGVPTVAILDHWTNYRERFMRRGRLVVPDRVAVMDDRARAGMVAAGIPPERIIETGQPWLGSLLPPAAGERARERAALRERIGAGIAEPVVVWVSQPLASGASLGFTAEQAFGDLLEALATLPRRSHIAFRRHPREPQVPPELTAVPDNVRVDLSPRDVPPRADVLGADCVVGMNSMLLIEACLLGTPVVSHQPGLAVADPLPPSPAGWSIAVTRPAELAAALVQALTAGPQPPRSLHTGAAERVVALVLDPRAVTA